MEKKHYCFQLKCCVDCCNCPKVMVVEVCYVDLVNLVTIEVFGTTLKAAAVTKLVLEP